MGFNLSFFVLFCFFPRGAKRDDAVRNFAKVQQLIPGDLLKWVQALGLRSRSRINVSSSRFSRLAGFAGGPS